MNRYTIRTATDAELKCFYSTPILPQFEAVWGLFLRDGTMNGACGVLPDPRFIGSPLEDAARTIGFLDLRPDIPFPIAMDVVRHMRAWLRRERRTVWVQCDDKHPRAADLLHALGFRPTNERRRDFQNTDRQLQMWVRPAE